MANLKVCDRCLMAIESREGKQASIPRYWDGESEDFVCDWCEEDGFDTLNEIIPYNGNEV